MTVRSAQSDVTAEIGTIVSTSVAEMVTEPLKLGSFVEARTRIQSFIRNGLFECADLSYEGMPISKCELDKTNLRSFKASLGISSHSEFVNPTLVTYVDQNKLQSSAIRRSIPVIIFVLSFGFIFSMLTVIALRIFAKEILSLSQEIETDKINISKYSFIREVNVFREKMVAYVQLKKDEIRSQTMVSISKQVAHDIRSPLSTLNLILSTLHDIPDDKKKLLNSATIRINTIASDLLFTSTSSNQIESATAGQTFKSNLEAHPVVGLVVDVLTEKKIQFEEKSGVEFEMDLADASDAYINMPESDLSRIMSNLINNSVESLGSEGGKISVRVVAFTSNILIVVRDTGKGIEKEVLEKLGSKPITFGKENTNSGNGLGVFHAVQTVKNFGGSLEIKSNLGSGTMVEIRIPRVFAPQ